MDYINFILKLSNTFIYGGIVLMLVAIGCVVYGILKLRANNDAEKDEKPND
jgi:hypothetical protein